MANAHHILDLNWEDLFDFEAWDHDTNVEVGQQFLASASPEHIKEELLGSGDQRTVEVTGQASATIRGLDRDADVADLGLLAETSASGDHEMAMTDVGALQSLLSQTFPNTLGTAAAICRSGTVQLQNDYDDIAAVKQSAKTWFERMLQVYDQPVPDRPPPAMAPELFHAVQRCYYQATVNLLRNRHQYHAENCMYLLLDAVTDANHHGPRFCRFGYTPDLTSICSKRLQRCIDLMASDWVARLPVLEQLELHSFAASPQEYARGVRLAAVTEMQAQEAGGRGECVPS
ncbi:hypothetical protein LTR95_005039 [Oleoguttula sp. CCFEE 5521]